jgi:S-sulfo-L-cysteine synthase (O-acetyl-L-serine-dependent)
MYLKAVPNWSYGDVVSHPIFHALNPAGKQFMSLRRLSSRLNRFEVDGIHVDALIPFGMFPHIKSIPAVEMMRGDFLAGLYEGKHTIVIDSSGNTGQAVARLAPAFGFREVKVVLAADVPQSKKEILAALSSVEIIEVAGRKSVAERAAEEARKPCHYHLNQYGHPGNLLAHEQYTGPEIFRLVGRDLAVIAIAMGSSGTAAGVGKFLKNVNPDITVLGVRPRRGEQVPGTRDERRMADVVTLPWQDYVDQVIEVGRKDSFVNMRLMWSEVEPQPGPSSGLAWRGLEVYLESLSVQERRTLAGKSACFVCPDDGRFYPERTTGELDPDQGLVR